MSLSDVLLLFFRCDFLKSKCFWLISWLFVMTVVLTFRNNNIFFLGLQEHPYLNRPWYKLHPCGTSECIKLLFQSDATIRTTSGTTELYLLSWFSVVGRMVGLSIPYEMIKCKNNT